MALIRFQIRFTLIACPFKDLGLGLLDVNDVVALVHVGQYTVDAQRGVAVVAECFHPLVRVVLAVKARRCNNGVGSIEFCHRDVI